MTDAVELLASWATDHHAEMVSEIQTALEQDMSPDLASRIQENIIDKDDQELLILTLRAYAVGFVRGVRQADAS